MNKYQKTLNGYLLWRSGTFLRPKNLTYSSTALAALQIMKAWESKGTPLPTETSEPELLSDYIQGKRSRDWHITEWRLGIKEGLFKPEEFVGTLGCISIDGLI